MLRCALAGINGLGAETAKNVILGNVKGVTLHDNADVSNMDLGSHFYVTEQVGPSRPLHRDRTTLMPHHAGLVGYWQQQSFRLP